MLKKTKVPPKTGCTPMTEAVWSWGVIIGDQSRGIKKKNED